MSYSRRIAKRERKAWLQDVYKNVSMLCIKYGSLGNTSGKKEAKENLFKIEDRIREIWSDESRVSVEFIRKNIKLKDLKWYIHNKVEFKDDIWNSDFLFGVVKHGKIIWSKRLFPSFSWTNRHDNLYDIIKTSPFGGKVNYNHKHECSKRFWSQVPALYLKHSEDTVSFMAGVLSAGNVEYRDGYSYATYSGRTVAYIKEWGIPIEYQDRSIGRNKKVFISPVWPALFSLKMPIELMNFWVNLDKPFNSHIYCPILWKSYAGDYTKGGIPYLKSRRSVYYDHKCEEGASKRLEKLRVSTGLISIDPRVGEVVKMWNKKVSLDDV